MDATVLAAFSELSSLRGELANTEMLLREQKLIVASLQQQLSGKDAAAQTSESPSQSSFFHPFCVLKEIAELEARLQDERHARLAAVDSVRELRRQVGANETQTEMASERIALEIRTRDEHIIALGTKVRELEQGIVVERSSKEGLEATIRSLRDQLVLLHDELNTMTAQREARAKEMEISYVRDFSALRVELETAHQQCDSWQDRCTTLEKVLTEMKESFSVERADFVQKAETAAATLAALTQREKIQSETEHRMKLELGTQNDDIQKLRIALEAASAELGTSRGKELEAVTTAKSALEHVEQYVRRETQLTECAFHRLFFFSTTTCVFSNHVPWLSD